MSGNQKYIVVFKEGVNPSDHKADLERNGGKVTHEYGTVLNGFAAEIPDSYITSLQSLQGDVIDYIEPDSTVTTQ